MQQTTALEVILITHIKDFALARIMLRSLQLYCKAITKVHVLIDEQEKKYWPHDVKVNVVTKQALWPEAPPDISGYKKQMILKFLSHQLVSSNFFWIIDSDMLLTNRITTADLGLNSRIKWFYEEWNGVNSIYKKECEDFLGFAHPFYFMTDPLYIFRKDVVLDLLARYDIYQLLNYQHPSEFQIYGAFAYKHYAHNYEFIASNTTTFAKCINQIPPSYLVLDENVKWQAYVNTSIIAIWSHWHLALDKMIEFYHDSQLYHFACLKDPIKPQRSDYLISENEINKKYIQGLYPDSWTKEEIQLQLPGDFSKSALFIQLESPAPVDHAIDYQLVSCAVITDKKTLNFTLPPGFYLLKIPLAKRDRHALRLKFSGGFKTSNLAEPRKFCARILKIYVGSRYSLKPSISKLKVR